MQIWHDMFYSILNCDQNTADISPKRNTNSHNITYSAGIIEDGGRV